MHWDDFNCVWIEIELINTQTLSTNLHTNCITVCTYIYMSKSNKKKLKHTKKGLEGH